MPMRLTIVLVFVVLLTGGCSEPIVTPSTTPSTTLPSVGNNGILQQDVTYRYRFYIHCGMEWLIGFNGTAWITDEPITRGMGYITDDLPQFFVNPDEVISPELWTHVTLVSEDELHITLPDGSKSSVYHPTDEDWPGCA